MVRLIYSIIISCDYVVIYVVLDLQAGAKGFQLSNPPILECCSLRASLKVFEQTSMTQLVCKSRLLTGYLELLLENSLSKKDKEKDGIEIFCIDIFTILHSLLGPHIEIITSSDPGRRGNQLSLHVTNCSITGIHEYLNSHGAVVNTISLILH